MSNRPAGPTPPTMRRSDPEAVRDGPKTPEEKPTSYKTPLADRRSAVDAEPMKSVPGHNSWPTRRA
jgi:hypothetical protein